MKRFARLGPRHVHRQDASSICHLAADYAEESIQMVIRSATDQVYSIIAGQWAACTVRTAAELAIMDAIAPNGSRIVDVADAVDCSIDGITRLLRACRALGLVEIRNDSVVRLTDAGRVLRSDSPVSLRALARLQGTPGVWALWGALPDSVRIGTTSASSTLGMSLFEFLQKESSEGRVFADAMGSLTRLVHAEAARVIDLGPDVDVIDVGGGSGGFLAALLAASPSARGVVLDTSDTLAHDDGSNTDNRAAKSDESTRIQFLAGNFFDALPPADWYILKSILSDWDDRQAVQILRNCRRAGGPTARALVVEQLLDATPPGDLDYAALMDMTLLALTPGGSRTLAEYDQLAAAGGWRRAQIEPAPAGYAFLTLDADDC